MKKLITVLSAFVVGGFLFAQDKGCGIDVVVGANFGFDRGEVKITGIEYKDKWQDTSGELKINTYNLFALNNHLGVYASFGYMLGTTHSEKLTANGIETDNDDSNFNQEIELFLGPAFGFDIGSNRLQIGVAFHTIAGIKKDKETGVKMTGYYYWTGFALTPQFRFGVDKRLSFVVGCDLAFDFGHKSFWTYDYDDKEDLYTSYPYFPDSSFRFGLTPYVGLGINF